MNLENELLKLLSEYTSQAGQDLTVRNLIKHNQKLTQRNYQAEATRGMIEEATPAALDFLTPDETG